MSVDARAAFAPLPAVRDEGGPVRRVQTPAAENSGQQWTPARELPPDAFWKTLLPHRRRPDHLAVYRAADGAVTMLVTRWNTDKGKDVRPLSWWVEGNGVGRWRLKDPPRPLPLYGQDRLAARPDSGVIVTEGEPKCDAAGRLLPDRVAVAWPHGAQAVARVDWSALTGRRVTVWPDADEPGRQAAAQVVRKLAEVGAAEVRVIDLDDLATLRAGIEARQGRESGGELPQGWDAADAEREGWTMADAAKAVELAQAPAVGEVQPDGMPKGFAMKPDGVWWFPSDEGKAPVWVCGPLEVLGVTADAQDGHHGQLLRWVSRTGQEHRQVIRLDMLAGDGTDLRRILLANGLVTGCGRGARELLPQYILQCRPAARWRCVQTRGWHGLAFVLRDRAGTVLVQEGTERWIFQGDEPAQPMQTAGDLDGWKREVAALAVGNSRLALALALGFASPLLALAGEESGGFHLRGGSSYGKTTVLRAAGSVFGDAPSSWHATGNGLEASAAVFHDGLLCLDEMGQVDQQQVQGIAYMLANGMGKARAGQTGGGREPKRWRLLFLSTGETGLFDHAGEAGGRVKAGAEIRCIDVPAEAGQGLGVWECLHGQADGAALSRLVQEAAGRQHGTAGPAFIRWIQAHRQEIQTGIRERMTAWKRQHVPQGASGQVDRVAGRFALVAVAGELATRAGITGWPEGEADRAVADCLRAHLADRPGGAGELELARGVAAVRRFRPPDPPSHAFGQLAENHLKCGDHAVVYAHGAGSGVGIIRACRSVPSPAFRAMPVSSGWLRYFPMSQS